MTAYAAKVDRETAKLCVGPGWHSLINMLYNALPDDVVVTQVKEKYGGLRFYVDAAPGAFHDLVEIAEGLSLLICEDCGKTGKMRTGGWLKTLCDGCEGKRRASDVVRVGGIKELEKMYSSMYSRMAETMYDVVVEEE